MVLHPVVFLVILLVEAAVVVQRLAVDRAAVGAGLGDVLDSLQCADVDEVDGRAGPFGHPQHPAEGDVLGLGAMHQRHIVPLGALLAGELLVHMLDHVVVLGVDQQHGA